MTEATIFFWDICPPEIVLKIFEYLDYKSLVNCLVVNERFHYCALKLCQKKGWPSIVKVASVDNGTTFLKKADLHDMDKVKNACLWQFVHKAQAVNTHNYECREVTNVHVYKEHLIVVCPDEIMFYDINHNTLNYSMKTPCLDFDENDYMRAMVRFENGEKALYLCGKMMNCVANWRLTAPDQNIQCFQQYKLYNQHCFINGSKNTLFRLTWVGEVWDLKFMARFFGHGTISDISVYEGHVYVLLNWGGLLLLDEGGRRFRIGPNLDLPTPSSLCPVMYHQCGAIVSVPRNQKFKLRHPSTEQFVMECPDLTCVLQHNEMFILGYANGKVEIYNATKLIPPMSTDALPELSFNIQTLIPRTLSSFSISGLEVAETAGSQTLFVVTQCEIHRINLVYPKNIISVFYD